MQKSMQQDQLHQGQKNQAQKSVRRFIQAQLITTVVLSVMLFIYDFTVAYSALAGGLIATLANAWFAIKVFRVKSKETPETLLATFYVGEIYKFVFTGAMFVIAFVLIKPLNVVALLGIYFLVHMTPAVVNVFSRDGLVKKSVGNVRDKES
jgi:ATP synthase protein I